MIFYHGTSKENWDAIQRTGGIHLSTKDIVKMALKKWNSRK